MRPEVLIERLDHVVRFGEGLSKTIGENDLAICEMAEDFAYGPLSGSRGIIGARIAEGIERFPKSHGSRGDD